jgi:citrate synthase
MLIMSSDKRKGLVGVVVDETAICRVAETGPLTYRGYAIEDLVAHCGFKEVAYLILNGDLPTAAEFKRFRSQERKHRDISPVLMKLIREFPGETDSMARLRTAVSYLGLDDPQANDNSLEANRNKAVRMLARIPTIIAADYRIRRGLEPIPPRNDLAYAENFFQMIFGEIPEKTILHCFEVTQILYAELGFGPSTFAARVVASSLSDIYSAVTAAVGSLKGPLHGGANAGVVRTLLDIGEPAKVAAWVERALAEKQTIIGFGHRIFKRGDPRVSLLYAELEKVARLKNGGKWLEIQEILADIMLERRKLHPNLDYAAGLAYYLMGFDVELAPALFAMSRVVGWSAHVMEQLAANKLIRPVGAYIGPAQRTLEAGYPRLAGKGAAS